MLDDFATSTPKLPVIQEKVKTPTTPKTNAMPIKAARTSDAISTPPRLASDKDDMTTPKSSRPPLKVKNSANKKFGNGTLRIFLAKNKNVKMVKLMKVKFDVSDPNIVDSESIRYLPRPNYKKKSNKLNVLKYSFKNRVKSSSFKPEVFKVDKTSKSEFIPDPRIVHASEPKPEPSLVNDSLKVKFVSHGNFRLKDRVKFSTLKVFAPTLKYLKSDERTKNCSSSSSNDSDISSPSGVAKINHLDENIRNCEENRLHFEENRHHFEENRRHFEKKDGGQTEESAADLDSDLFDIVHR